jgi:beta-ureidopropionase / N-carbamoyl-L-amino-acid hydrolase
MGIETAISESRLWTLLMELARYGATPNGGVNRQALSSAELGARRYMIAWAKERNFGVTTDGIGNIFVRRNGTDNSLAPVLTGSHLDSQPTGGKFDGSYGVAASMEILAALDELGISTRRPIEVVSWTNEEGCRFFPACIGSGVFAGAFSLDSVLPLMDPDGIKLGDALAATMKGMDLDAAVRPASKPHCYIEAHIEQGPLLELANIPIGVVTGFQGGCRIKVEVTGQEGHSGTTPRRTRKDALFSAVEIISALKQVAQDQDDILRFTVGRFEVFPGSPNTVPGRVVFVIDMRHPDNTVLRSKADEVQQVAMASAGSCSVDVMEMSYRPPSGFQPAVIDAIRQSAAALGVTHLEMTSGAGHDAVQLDKICPTGMIFIPCWRGLSHNEAESITPEASAIGARVLARTVVVLADR